MTRLHSVNNVMMYYIYGSRDFFVARTSMLVGLKSVIDSRNIILLSKYIPFENFETNIEMICGKC